MENRERLMASATVNTENDCLFEFNSYLAFLLAWSSSCPVCFPFFRLTFILQLLLTVDHSAVIAAFSFFEI